MSDAEYIKRNFKLDEREKESMENLRKLEMLENEFLENSKEILTQLQEIYKAYKA